MTRQTVRLIDRGLSWTARRYHYFSGPYAIMRPERGSGWVARRSNNREHGPQSWPTELGRWRTWVQAAQACEIDAIRERTC